MVIHDEGYTQDDANCLADEIDAGNVPVPAGSGLAAAKFRFEDGNTYTLLSDVFMWPTETASRICNDILPEWLGLFLEKNAGYGDMHNKYGPKAQFLDISRKFGKLERALWDEKDIGPEDVREVAMDMIGHLFLLIDLLDQEG